MAFLGLFLACFITATAQEKPTQLKQIKIVKTNFKDLKSGEIINKTITLQDGKLSSIQTSDVTQNFFYNPKGLLDRSVKEKMGVNWKEVVNYSYDTENRLIKFTKKYQEENESLLKTVSLTYQGARVNVITRKSTTKDAIVENIDYIVENGLVTRRSTRDRNDQIINKIEYVYANGNCVKQVGLLGDKSIKYYNFDDKNSPELAIVKNAFGENYKVIVPIISYHEEEFNFQMISPNNELTYRNSAIKDVIKAGKFKYNNLSFPTSYLLIENEGMLKTVKTYSYE